VNLKIIMKFLEDRKIFQDSDSLPNSWESSDIFGLYQSISTIFVCDFCIEVCSLTRTGERDLLYLFYDQDYCHNLGIPQVESYIPEE
jgi:hypothetical protein